MKAILIDSKQKSVSLVMVGDEAHNMLHDMHTKIGCDIFTSAGHLQHEDMQDTLYVDDNGLINGTEEFFFNPDFYPHPLAGNGLIIGTDVAGESIDVKSETSQVAKNTEFMSRAEMAAGLLK